MKYSTNDSISNYGVQNTFPDFVVVHDWDTDIYYSIPYTIDLNGEIQLGDATELEEYYSPKQEVINSMKSKQPIILLNSESENPTYRVLVQTGNELPAHDMGLDKIRYNEDAIKTAITGLNGQFVYDETQSGHDKQFNGNRKGHKFAKIANTGYCPQYGAYADWEVFDEEYIPLMNQYLDSYKKGLPIHEGPSTELQVKEAQKYGQNNAEITEFDYNGVVWIDNPRDSNLGVCSVVNSIKEVIGDEKVVEKNKEMVQLNKEEYDELIQKKAELEELKPKYTSGETLYNKGKKLYDDLKTEAKDLKEQLLPIWKAQEEDKTAIVNSLLETVPQADKEARKKELEGKDLGTLKFIVNSLPEPTGDAGSRGIHDGITNGGPGSGRQQGGSGETKIFDDPEKQKKYEEAQSLASGSNNSVIKSTKGDE